MVQDQHQFSFTTYTYFSDILEARERADNWILCAILNESKKSSE